MEFCSNGLKVCFCGVTVCGCGEFLHDTRELGLDAHKSRLGIFRKFFELLYTFEHTESVDVLAADVKHQRVCKRQVLRSVRRGLSLRR